MSARHSASSSGVGGGGASKRFDSLMCPSVFYQGTDCQAGKNQQIRWLWRLHGEIFHVRRTLSHASGTPTDLAAEKRKGSVAAGLLPVSPTAKEVPMTRSRTVRAVAIAIGLASTGGAGRGGDQ
jgi:hypothetical protein